jgi:citrate lyase subunit beta / citryl-CoA lyase
MQRRPYRTTLFLPAGRPNFVPSALAAKPDACIVDLEDAVHEGGKAEARLHARDMIGELAAAGMPVYVRLNSISTSHWLQDLTAVTLPGLVGIGLSKTDGPEHVSTVDHVLTSLERAAGLETGRIDIQPLLETASGMHRAYDILRASPRVRSYFAGSARDGDIIRELGARWTKAGWETFYVRSKLLLDGRAAGVPYPITGTWTDVSDTEGLRSFAESGRDLGYCGMYVIHPSHVGLVNQVFTPSSEEIKYFRSVLAELESAEKAARGAASVNGVMIDIAMANRARAFLELAASLGLEGGHDES